MNPQHHHHNFGASLMEKQNSNNQVEDNMPWFARPVVGSTTVTTNTPGLTSKSIYTHSAIRDKEFVSSSNPPISMTAAARSKKLTICETRLAGVGSGSSNSTLSRSISPSSAEESFLNRSNHEDNYYSFYPSNNEEEKIRSAHRFLINVRDNELHLPEGNIFN
jgi:hypothetical protein